MGLGQLIANSSSLVKELLIALTQVLMYLLKERCHLLLHSLLSDCQLLKWTTSLEVPEMTVDLVYHCNEYVGWWFFSFLVMPVSWLEELSTEIIESISWPVVQSVWFNIGSVTNYASWSESRHLVGNGVIYVVIAGIMNVLLVELTVQADVPWEMTPTLIILLQPSTQILTSMRRRYVYVLMYWTVCYC
jgi:hypothetical protein